MKKIGKAKRNMISRNAAVIDGTFLKRTWFSVVLGLIILGMLLASSISEASEVIARETTPVAEEEVEADPWEPFNEKMFRFNHKVLDRYFLKPVAKAWDLVLPDPVQRSLRNAVDNTNFMTRLVNSLAQGKFGGAGRDLARVGINTIIGLGGLFDVAGAGFGIERSDEDTGQTLGFYGVGPGPYLVLPLLPPMNVRDGLGGIVDRAMNPINYLIPFAANADAGTTVGALIGITLTDAINQRSLNLETFEGIEQAVIDLYSAVRDGYQQQREAKIKE